MSFFLFWNKIQELDKNWEVDSINIPNLGGFEWFWNFCCSCWKLLKQKWQERVFLGSAPTVSAYFVSVRSVKLKYVNFGNWFQDDAERNGNTIDHHSTEKAGRAYDPSVAAIWWSPHCCKFQGKLNLVPYVFFTKKNYSINICLKKLAFGHSLSL